MYGTNPIRPPVKGNGEQLDVEHIFATLQGEGPYAGWPSVFVRLGGCNLACDFCDTEFESFKPMAKADILSKVKDLAKGVRKLVVITGGEPLRQNIVPLCEQLIASGFKVQIETNGTLFQALPAEVDIICSPKNTGNGYFPLRPDLLERVQALKFILSKTHPGYQAVPDVGQKEIPVYVQPMDEHDDKKNNDNVAFAAHIAHTHGYRLSLQLHKILGME